MRINVQKLDPSAILPRYAHPGDAGMDVFALEPITIEHGVRVAARTGIAMAIPQGYVGLVWDKSGRALNDGLKTMAGVIDSGYRGEVKIVLLNTATKTIEIAKGEKIAQILVQPVVSFPVEELDSLGDTTRGDSGFGSTGLL